MLCDVIIRPSGRFSLKMEAFWGKLKENLTKKTEIGVGTLACDMWVGAKEHSQYRCIRFTWPDDSKCTERAHAYMVLKEEIRQGKKKQEVSHLCHKSLCVNTDHLCLESHETNMKRTLCKSQGQCSALH